MQRTTFFESALSKKTLLLCFGLALGVVACGDDDPVNENPPPASVEEPAEKLSQELKTDLQAILDDLIAKKLTPGVTLYVSTKKGDAWSTSAGFLDLETKSALTPNAPFRSGSIMKTFVATAIMQAVEAGKIGLDDAITKHLPASMTSRIANADKVTIRLLLAHRTGTPEWLTDEIYAEIQRNPSHVWSTDEILAHVEKLPVVAPPNERYSYSNTNYVLLGEVLTGIHGRSWRDVLRNDVIVRAGLTQTVLPNAGDLECASCAHGYLPMQGQLIDVTRVDPSMAGASGGHALVSTAPDLGKFFLKLRQGELFEKKSTVDAMFAFQDAPEEETRQIGYGFGTMKMESNGVTAFGHLGGTAGYHSFMLYIPATDRYVTGVTTVTGSMGAVLVPIMTRVAQR